MGEWTDRLSRLARAAGEVVAETLWPTRCALCDAPGEVLCDCCERELPYLDWWQACKRCGAPYGLVQCVTCNPISLGRIGRAELPFASCASATTFTNESGRVVRIYKDHGERRLADEMARIMARVVPGTWEFDGVTFVPATKRAVRNRGFDHAELLAQRLAVRLDVPLCKVLARPRTHDQRHLSAAGRIENLSSAFRASDELAVAGRRLVLVDDVFTTGSTLCAATDALTEAGAEAVYCLTFARV